MKCAKCMADWGDEVSTTLLLGRHVQCPSCLGLFRRGSLSGSPAASAATLSGEGEELTRREISDNDPTPVVAAHVASFAANVERTRPSVPPYHRPGRATRSPPLPIPPRLQPQNETARPWSVGTPSETEERMTSHAPHVLEAAPPAPASSRRTLNYILAGACGALLATVVLLPILRSGALLSPVAAPTRRTAGSSGQTEAALSTVPSPVAATSPVLAAWPARDPAAGAVPTPPPDGVDSAPSDGIDVICEVDAPATTAPGRAASPQGNAVSAGAMAAETPSEILTREADAAVRANEFASALYTYQRALATNGNYLPARLGAAHALWQLGRRDEAAHAYKSIVTEYPENLIPPLARVRAAAVSP